MGAPAGAALAEDDGAARLVAERLLARGERLAVAETTAGGLLSARLLSVPGASAWFDRGVVCYGGTSKQDTTGVSIDALRAGGAVSVSGVAAMARGLRQLAGTDWALAESGIAGPQGSRRSVKPIGSVVIVLIGPDGEHAEEHVFPGSRVEVMGAIAERCLGLLGECIGALTG